MKVSAVMSKPVITITPETPVKTAARLLVSCGISGLPIVDRQGDLVGIVSEADLLRIEMPIRPTAVSAPRVVAQVMTTRVVTVDVDADASEAARLMIDANVKRLPVLDEGRLVGVVSRRDLVRVIARADDDLQAEVARRLLEFPVGIARDGVRVDGGIATIRMEIGGDRRLAESIALTVPGVLEVRFASPADAAG